MKALVLKEYKSFLVEEVPSPAFGPRDVLVRVMACGICGSDVHGMDGSTGRRRPPLIMGHEAAGVIEAVGAEVGKAAAWRPGDRVTFDSTISCGECWHCRRGEINLCDSRRVLGVSCADYRQNGAFADLVAVPAHILYRLPEGLPFEEAAMVEALSIAVHAAGRLPVTLGDSAVVIGAGMIGLLALQALKARGCGPVIVADVERDRLALAQRLGADAVIDSAVCDVPAEVRALTGARGADVAIEAVGITTTVRTAIACLRKGGSLALVGNVSPDVEMPLQSAVTREISLLGCCASRGEYPVCLRLMGEKRVDVRSLISAVAALAEGPSWFERLYNHEKGLIKVILTP